MKKQPVDQDWNQYWSREETRRFTKISWSKRRIISILMKHMTPGKNALDAGCGSGFFAKFFVDQKMSTTALDYSQEALQIAKSKMGNEGKVIQADLLEDSLKDLTDDRYALIFTDGLFEHFSENQKDIIIQNFKGVLDDDGVIITFVPNRYSPWEFIRPFYMPGIEERPFTLKQLLELNSRNGLKVFESGGVNTLPFRYSPDQLLGKQFGMLLYTLAH
ncbi:MAG: class I SAM-dependent methyltransferase [Candidatus Omnitrophica bacterium]|nr:class I SAM-dependent methyltransferase [Candidatus Omnitrophota bacterium]